MTLSDWIAFTAVAVACLVAGGTLWTVVTVAALQRWTDDVDARLDAIEERLDAPPRPSTDRMGDPTGP
jgi:hypothetical protein